MFVDDSSQFKLNILIMEYSVTYCSDLRNAITFYVEYKLLPRRLFIFNKVQPYASTSVD